MTFPYGEMLPVLRRISTRDRYGDGGQFDVHHEIGPCGVAWNETTENTDGREAIVSDATVYAPTGSDVLATDQIELPDGDRYRVVGKPARWGRHPVTGWQPANSVVIRLNRVA